MRITVLSMSLLGLILTLGPSLFVFVGKISWALHSRLMLVGMLLWFVFAPMGLKDKQSTLQGGSNEKMD